MTGQPVDFYFDFSSPYGYLASHRIDHIAANHHRETLWRPILLGAVFKVSGGRPLSESPLKWEYSTRDFARSARLANVPFALPEPFPFSGVAASRAFYWICEKDRFLAKDFAKAVFHAAFAEGLDMGAVEQVAAVADRVGVEPKSLLTALGEPAVKEMLKIEVDEAIARGVFGSPFVIVDGEPFWGHDRLPEVDAWLASGGW
jgi:2-hydroxychromene-2-carboxylate isomerase